MSRPQSDYTEVITVSPTVDTGIFYASGDLIGGKLTLAAALGEARTGEITGVILQDLAAQNAALDIVFFDSDPTGTTFTDNAALDVATADLAKVIGVVKIVAGDYHAFADNSVAVVGPSDADSHLPLGVKSSGSETLYACIVSRGTPTYVAATDVKLKVVFRQD